MINKAKTARHSIRKFIRKLPAYIKVIVWVIVFLYFLWFFILVDTYYFMMITKGDLKLLAEIRMYTDMFFSPARVLCMTGLLSLLVDANNDGLPDPLEKNVQMVTDVNNRLQKDPPPGTDKRQGAE